MEEQFYTIILRHDTSTKWMVNDPVLYLGEYGVEDDTHKVKRGDGESKWSELPYEDFGLQYIVTFDNLHGNVENNTILVNKFEEKVDKVVFEDVNNTIVSGLVIADENIEEGKICDVSRITKNVLSGVTTKNTIIIKSTDKTVQSVWSTDENGNKIVNLMAASAIGDYVPGKKYYKDQLCYNGNKLYRAFGDIIGENSFNPDQWVLLASLHSGDIKYDNLVSGLDSETVKEAIDELKRRDDRKVQKSTETRIVYGTTQTGEQTVIPIDDLRKVDAVNHKQADLNKNVQIDASDINYSDADPSIGTIRYVLDKKVDKTFAGQGARIVRDVQFEYNESTGQIKLIEDKVSPEDGTSAIEERVINVVSESELNTAIENVNTTINTKEGEIYTRIQAEHNEINNRVDTEVATLNSTIDSEVATLNDTIDTEVATLNSTIDTKETEIYTRIQAEHNEINNRVNTEVATLNSTIDTKEANLQTQIDTNASEIVRVENAEIVENTRIENESKQRDNNLSTQISTTATNINNRIDTEVAALNTTINTKETLMDNKKIDKDISDTIVTAVDVATHDSQPTIRTVNKNTNSKAATYDYIHFGTQGSIVTRMEDADHIIIDSTTLDTMNTQQNTRLTNAENRLNAHDSTLAALQEHDVNHDRVLATHTTQLSAQETRMGTIESDLVDLDTKIESEITNRTTADTNLSTRIADNAVRIANNTQAIRDNADSIDQLAQTLEENVEALTNSKVNKDFAENINNKIVGKLESDVIANTELFNLKETMISPIDGTTSVERIKIISSDNTVVATRRDDGTIDLATNLDTDVNYFVTTEIISTTVAAETILDMTQLTPTDKQEVEVQDIISDPEGTWGRVKSIDTENNTCTVVTFKKHAQAVWGTIKGNIVDQQDLQAALSDLSDDIDDETTNRISADTTLQTNIDNEIVARQNADTTLQTNINNEKTARQNADNILQDNIDTVANNLSDEIFARGEADSSLQTNINNEKIARQNADTTLQTNINNEANARLAADTKLNNNLNAEAATRERYDVALNNIKLGKVDTPNIVYGTDETGTQITYDKNSFGKVDTVNNVQPDNNKNVTIGTDNITSEDIDGDTTTLSTVITELQTLVENLKADLQTQIKTYTQNTAYMATGNYVTQKYVTFTRSDGIMLMAKILNDFISNSSQITTYDSFMYDIEHNNLLLVGIPEQQGEAVQTTSLNITLQDTNGQTINPTTLNSPNAYLMSSLGRTEYTSISSTGILFDNLDGNDTYTVYIDSDEYVVNASSYQATGGHPIAYVTSGQANSLVVILLAKSAEEQSFDILDEVDNQGDTYEGLGGTEEEVEAILDEIIEGGSTPTIVYPQVGDTLQIKLKANPTVFTGTLPADYLSFSATDEYNSIDLSVANWMYSEIKAPAYIQEVEGASDVKQYTYEKVNNVWNWYFTETYDGETISGPTIINNPQNTTKTITIENISNANNMQSLYPILLQYFDITIL